MARGRKSTKIKKITGADAAFLRGLADTGVATLKHAKAAKISEDRLRKLERSGYIEKTSEIAGRKNVIVYKLAPEGAKYAKKELGKKIYCVSMQHVNHEIKLADYYWSLPAVARKSWLNETEIRNKYGVKSGESCIDAAIEYDGEYVAVEAVTKNYSAEIIEAKRVFADRAGFSSIWLF